MFKCNVFFCLMLNDLEYFSFASYLQRWKERTGALSLLVRDFKTSIQSSVRIVGPSWYYVIPDRRNRSSRRVLVHTCTYIRDVTQSLFEIYVARENSRDDSQNSRTLKWHTRSEVAKKVRKRERERETNRSRYQYYSVLLAIIAYFFLL